jgi:outer membrane protein OmpA-like peptidoglycan-associated protein
MVDSQLKFVSGEFEGYFYTHQKMPMGELEKLPGGRAHEVYVYRGELRNYRSLAEYKPEEHLNRDGLLLHNVTNIQLSNGSGTEKRVYDFDQLVLKDVQVEQSWELEGKTYGILKGTLVGKIKKHAVTGTDNSTNVIPPPPPKNPGRKWWDPAPNNTGNSDPGVSSGGGTGNSGCLSRIWDILKWLLLILLFLLLYKSCIKDDNCCLEVDLIKKKNDSLTQVVDSLILVNNEKDSINKVREENELQEQIDNIAEQIYFYRGKDVIRDYSVYQLDNLIRILKKYPYLKITIEGHINGNSSDPNLDLKRADKVKSLLIERGINSDRLQTIGMGGTTPIDDPDNEVGVDPWGNTYNRNMRVEIKIQK